MKYGYYTTNSLIKYFEFKDDKVINSHIYKKSDELKIFDLVLCKVGRKHLNGYFVELPFSKMGYLSTDKKFSDSQIILARIKRLPREDKDYMIDLENEIKDDYFIYDFTQNDPKYSKKLSDVFRNELAKVFKDEKGYTFRTNLGEFDIESIKKFFNSFKEKIEAIKRKERISKVLELVHSYYSEYSLISDTYKIRELEDDFFTYGIMNVAIFDGIRVTFDKTSAMNIFDIDSHKFISNDISMINKKAYELILEMIKFKNIYGIILIDFLKGDNLKFIENNDSDMKYFGKTRLGIGEFTRRANSSSVFDIGIDICLLDYFIFRYSEEIKLVKPKEICLSINECFKNLGISYLLQESFNCKVDIEYNNTNIIGISYVK
jgi:hypothetical protein